MRSAPARWALAAAVTAAILTASAGATTLRQRGVPIAWFGVPIGTVAIALVAQAYREARVPRQRAMVVLALSVAIGAGVMGSLDRWVERFHVATFGLLGFALARAVGSAAPAGLATASGLAFGAAVADEILQGALAGRYYEARDVGLNVASIALGLLVAHPTLGGDASARAELTPPRGLRRGAGATVVLALAAMVLAERPAFDPTLAVGTWHGINECGGAEVLDLGASGVLGWSDADGHTASGTWEITSNAFDEIQLFLRVTEDRNDSDSPCGLRADGGPGGSGLYGDPFRFDGDRFVYGASIKTTWHRAGHPAAQAADGS